MSRELSYLAGEFRVLCEKLIAECAAVGVTMVPFFTLRDPYTQARLWRQSRSRAEVEAAISDLKREGATYLAHCLESVGPQHGKWATNALPGYSWHQWGRALDCFWLVDGKAEWSDRKGGDRNGYRVYAEIAKRIGLTPGGYWKRSKDWPHVQHVWLEVDDVHTPRRVDEEMQYRWSEESAGAPRILEPSKSA